MLLFGSSVYSQDAEPTSEDSQALEDVDGLSMDNPSSIADQYKLDREPKEYLFKIPGGEKILKPWSDLRLKLDEKYGFKPNISFTHLYQWASD